MSKTAKNPGGWYKNYEKSPNFLQERRKKNQRRITKIGNENGNTNTKKIKETRTKSAGKENETCCVGTSATLIF
jgi:hypothetical protein